MIIILIEHVILLFKFSLSVIIKDKPEWVVKEETMMHDSQDQMMRQIEIKKEEYIIDKKELLED